MTSPPRARLGSILIASDLAGEADPAVSAGVTLAAALGAGVHGLYVEEVEYDGRSASSKTGAPRRRSSDPALQLEGSISAARPDVQVSSVYQTEGRAGKGIIDRAREVDADLIVLGPHRRRLGAGLLGSTADHVVKASRVPIVLANGPLELPLRYMTVPIDLSPASMTALSFALAFGAEIGAATGTTPAIEVLHVAPHASGEHAAGVERALLKRTVEEEVRTLVSGLGWDGAGPSWSVAIDQGLPVEERVLARLAEKGGDLLVLGTRGSGAWRRVLLGSVASKVARSASVPVILVPSREEHTDEREAR